MNSVNLKGFIYTYLKTLTFTFIVHISKVVCKMLKFKLCKLFNNVLTANMQC